MRLGLECGLHVALVTMKSQLWAWTACGASATIQPPRIAAPRSARKVRIGLLLDCRGVVPVRGSREALQRGERPSRPTPRLRPGRAEFTRKFRQGGGRDLA